MIHTNIRKTAGLIAVAAVAAGAIDFSRVSVDSLRTNITWLASDERGGRMTPSAGLDASADYLGAQFRLAGLAPGGARNSYFQDAAFSEVSSTPDDFRMTLEAGTKTLVVTPNSVDAALLTSFDLRREPVMRLPRTGPLPEIQGRVVAGDEHYSSGRARYLVEAGKPSLILLLLSGPRPKHVKPALTEADPALPQVIRIYSGAAGRMLAGNSEARLTLHVGNPLRSDVTLRNVAGIVRGSDPVLRDQFVIVSAHYDHLGMAAGKVYPGANDDASGAASLIEIAKVLAAEAQPKRSVLFLALFGEEEGLLGSGYYVRHPLVPIANTIADINLEQLGRTDSEDGPEIARFALTGPSYSDLESVMSAAAKTQGAVVYKKTNADDYFERSDNFSFAVAGIVAHTAVVAFEFRDYHAVADDATKIDYQNLAKVDRGIAAGVAAVANAAQAPKWSGPGNFRKSVQ